MTCFGLNGYENSNPVEDKLLARVDVGLIDSIVNYNTKKKLLVKNYPVSCVTFDD